MRPQRLVTLALKRAAWKFPYLLTYLLTFKLYEITVAVALFDYVVVFIVFLCVVS